MLSNTFTLVRVIIYKISRLRKRQFSGYKTDNPFFPLRVFIISCSYLASYSNVDVRKLFVIVVRF